MAFQTATNRKTGEKAVLINGQWVPYTQTATNRKTGEKAVLVNGRWVTEGQIAKSVTQPAEQVAPKERPGFWGSFMESAQTLGLADEAAEFAANPTDENRRKLLAAGESKFQSVGGFGKGENWEAFKELIGGTVGQMVAPIAAGTVASVATTPLGGIAAGYGTATTQYTTQGLLRQAQEQERALAEGRTPEETSALKAVAAGAASAGLDYIGFNRLRAAVEATPFLKNLITPSKELAEDATKKLIQAARDGTLKTTARGTVEGAVKGTAFEIPQEVAQTALERWQAGLSLSDQEARDEYTQAAIGAAILGPVMGGAAGAVGARKDRAKAEELVKAQEKPVTTGEAPPSVAETKPTVRVEEPPLKVVDEKTPPEVRQEPAELTPEQIRSEIVRLEQEQKDRSDVLSDLDTLKTYVESVGGDYDAEVQRLTQNFDDTASQLNVFRNRLDELSKSPEGAVGAGVAPIPQTAAAQQTIQIDPALAKGLNLPGAEAAPKDQPFTVQAAPVAPIPQVGTAQQALGLGETAAPAPGISVDPTVTAPGVAPIPQNAAAQQALPTPTPAVPVDPVYQQAVEAVTTSGKTSISSLQEKLNIPYSRARALIKQMEVEGVVSRPDKSGKRKVMMGAAPEETRAAEQTTQGVAEQVEREPVGGGVGVPPSGPPAAGPAVEAIEDAGVEPAARVAGDVVGGEAALPSTLEPAATEPAAAPAELPPIPELREDATDAEIRAYYEAMQARDAAMGVKPTPTVKRRKPKPPKSVEDLKGVDLNDLGNAIGRAIKNLPMPNEEIRRAIRRILDSERIKDNLRAGIYAFTSIPQQVYIFSKELPALRYLLRVLNAKASGLKARREKLNRNVNRWTRAIKQEVKKNAAIKDKFYFIAHESTRLQVDFYSAKFANHPLTKQFNALPDSLKNVYKQMLDSYREMGDEYVDLITKNLSPSAANEIRKLWAEKRLQVYLPLYREGDYWVRYEAVLPDGKTETVYRAFMSPEAREQGIEDAEREGIVGEAQRFSRIDQAFGGESVGPFFNKVMEELKAKKVPPAVMNSLYELYLDQIPASSVRQMHRTREGYKGYESDLINVYSTVGSRMMNQLNNLEFIPDLDAAYAEVEEQAAVSAASSRNLAVNKLMANLKLQREYWNDPTHNALVTTATSFSYYWYIIANVSTAVINLSQIPMVVYPMLTGRFGAKAGDALTKAKDIYFQGGWDKVTDNDSEIADWSFGVNLPPNSPLKKLYDLAVNQSAIRRSSGYDLAEGRKKVSGTSDYVGMKVKLEQGAGWIFQNSERFNREVTLIAAFNLELEKNGGNVNAAAQYAIDLVNDAHGVVLNETSPRIFQTGLGKVLFIFKNFAQTQIFLQYKLINQMYKGESKEVKREAAKQMLGIYGMAFLFAGVQGLPFYGALSVLAGLLEEWIGDDDNPIDVEEFARQSITSLAMRGPLSEVLQTDLYSRTGFNNLLWREDERRVDEIGPVLFAMEQIFGASYSAAMGIGRGIKDFNEGHVDRAIESFVPSVIRNPLKAFRFATDGAQTRDGKSIVAKEEFSNREIVLQALGFTPLKFAERSKAAGTMSQQMKRLEERKQSIYNKFYLAYIISKSEEDKAEAQAAREKFNNSPFVIANNERIKDEDIRRSIAQRRRMAQQSVYGVNVPLKRRAAYESYLREQDQEGT